uniref:Uncharacterized protein n=1 Tax=Romanomermis culicivorax TaxID=13658 RepID=A0A915L5Y7_ROMCU
MFFKRLHFTATAYLLISNNLSNLEAEEEEDIMGSLSDDDEDALLGRTLKPKGRKLSFWECQVDKTLPIELSMLKSSLNLALQHKFGEAVLEWVNYLRFHKNAIPEKNQQMDSMGMNLINLCGSADEDFWPHIPSFVSYCSSQQPLHMHPSLTLDWDKRAEV